MVIQPRFPQSVFAGVPLADLLPVRSAYLGNPETRSQTSRQTVLNQCFALRLSVLTLRQFHLCSHWQQVCQWHPKIACLQRPHQVNIWRRTFCFATFGSFWQIRLKKVSQLELFINLYEGLPGFIFIERNQPKCPARLFGDF